MASGAPTRHRKERVLVRKTGPSEQLLYSTNPLFKQPSKTSSYNTRH